MSGRPKASTSGQYDGDGRCTSVGVALLDDVLGARRCAPGGRRSSSPYLRCQKSSSSVTSGTASKLCAGAGDGIIHSSCGRPTGRARRAAPVLAPWRRL